MKKAKLFKNGQSQAVRLPKEFRFDGDEVLIKRTKEGVLLVAVDKSWEPLLNSLGRFSSDFMSDRAQPTDSRGRQAQQWFICRTDS